MGMLYATVLGIFFVQFYDSCMDWHRACYVSPNLCRKQKQTDACKYYTDNEEERITHTHYMPTQETLDCLLEIFMLMQRQSANLNRDLSICQCEFRMEEKQNEHSD